MSQTIVTRNISQTAKLGHRLIKFRYGPHRNQQTGTQQSTGSGASNPASKTAQQGSQEAIWDFQLPARWRRAPLTDEEIAVINNGGPL